MMLHLYIIKFIEIFYIFNYILRRENMDLKNKIQKDIKDNSIMLYMKGTKEMPMCGFSSTVVNILNQHNIDYYVNDDPTISDIEYDKLLRKLEVL